MLEPLGEGWKVEIKEVLPSKANPKVRFGAVVKRPGREDEEDTIFVWEKRLSESDNDFDRALLGRIEIEYRSKLKAMGLLGVKAETNEVEEVSATNVIRIIRDVPEFAGAGGIRYKLMANDVANLPLPIAKALVANGVAVEVDARLASGQPSKGFSDSASLMCSNAVPKPGTASERDGGRADASHHNPSVAEAQSINKFLKTARSEGIEAAVKAKRKEDEPRITAWLRQKEAVEQTDREALRTGQWTDVVNGAIDELLAGEDMLRKLAIYSGLSANLKGGRTHLWAIGDSQVGKSFVFRSIGSKLFPDNFIDLASLSPKALYYMADEGENSRFLEGKILFVDELADQDDGARSIIKQITSNGSTGAEAWTVDEHKKPKKQKLEGVPAVWLTSAEVIEDKENQLKNRFLLINPDESEEQTRKVEDLQRKAISDGLLEDVPSTLPRARRLLDAIRADGNFEIYNPFAYHIKTNIMESRVRNTLPSFFNLVGSITYAHRFGRPSFTLKDGTKALISVYADNIEAAELWMYIYRSKITGLPQRHNDLLAVLPPYTGLGEGLGLKLEEVTERYNKKKGREHSAGTVRNYLYDLSSRDKATYYKDEEGEPRWHAIASPKAVTNLSQFVVVVDSDEGKKLLDNQLKALEGWEVQSPAGERLSNGQLRVALTGSTGGAKEEGGNFTSSPSVIGVVEDD